jgi:hypothetical protein
VIFTSAVFFAELVNKPIHVFFLVAQLVSLLLAEGKYLFPTALLDKALNGFLHKFVHADMPCSGNLFSLGEQGRGNTRVQIFFRFHKTFFGSLSQEGAFTRLFKPILKIHACRFHRAFFLVPHRFLFIQVSGNFWLVS